MPKMPASLAYRIYRLVWQGLDWVYPPSCAGCGQRGGLWCEECVDKTARLDSRLCLVCGVPIKTDRSCRSCQQAKPYYTALRSWGVFDGSLRRAIHQLKYRRNMSLGYSLAMPMITMLSMLDWPVDLIAPVPLSLARLAERGYNQASLLAMPIALYFNYKYKPGIIRRCKETKSQVGLSLTERRDNVADAFEAERDLVKDHCVLVVDDVITSGSTMNACAKSLLEAGAQKVYGLSLARAGFQGKQDQKTKLGYFDTQSYILSGG